MKPRHFILYALWAMIVGTVIGITACSDTTYTSRLRELILEDMTFDSGKGTQYLTFRNEDLSSYECKSSEKWCTVAFDTEYCKLAVSVEANDTSYDERKATIILADKMDNTQRSFTVTQNRQTGLFLGKTEFDVAMEGESITVNVESNVDYKVVIPDSIKWVSLSEETKTRGLEKSSFTLDVKENDSYNDRTAKIKVISNESGLSGTVTIRQKFTTEFSVDTKHFEVKMAGDTLTVNVESNVSYDVIIPDTISWIKLPSTSSKTTRSSTSSEVTLCVSENTTYYNRDAVVTISNPDACVSIPISIHQLFTSVFSADSTDFDIDMDGGKFTVNMKSNIPYDINIPDSCDWIAAPTNTGPTSVSSTTTTTALVFRVKANDTYKHRDAIITIVNEEIGKEIKISVHQPFTTTFSVDQTNFDVSMDGETLKVNVESNVSYDVSIPSDCDWVTIPTDSRKAGKKKASATSTVVLRVKENTSYKDRDAVITISNEKAGISTKIYIHQSFTTTFSVDQTNFDVSMDGETLKVKIESNISYNVSIPSDCDWVTIPTDSRKAGREKASASSSSLVLSVKKNTSYKDRDAVVTISNEEAGVSTKIFIHQPFKTTFKADNTDFDIDMDGAKFTVNMESNIPYDINVPSDCDWISASTTSVSTSISSTATTTALTFRAKANDTYKNRDATISIVNKEAGEEIKINVHQPFTTSFSVDKTDFDIDMDGGTVTVNIESNVSYDVSIPSDCDWVTIPTDSRQAGKRKASTSSSLVLRVKENTSYKDRDAVITISNEKAGVSTKISIHQSFTASLSVDKDEFDVDMAGGTVTVNVESNVSYDVSIPSDCDWVTIPTDSRKIGIRKASSSSSLVLRVEENTSYKDRNVVITISNEKAGVSKKIKIKQSFTTTFSVDKTDVEVPSDGGYFTLSVESNISYDVKVPSECDWISQVSEVRRRSTKTSIVTFKVSKNSSGSSRSTTIGIGNSDAGVSATVNVSQPFETVFSVDETSQEIDELGGTIGISVAATVSVQVTPQVSWLSVGDKTNIGDGYWTQQIKVEKLTSKVSSRKGKVKFLYAAGNESKYVEIIQNHLLYITESEITLTEEGQTQTLTLNNSEAMGVKWSSSDEGVAKVNSSGKVTAVANGTAVITVKSKDGNYSDTVDVTVEIEEPEEEDDGGDDGDGGT